MEIEEYGKKPLWLRIQKLVDKKQEYIPIEELIQDEQL